VGLLLSIMSTTALEAKRIPPEAGSPPSPESGITCADGSFVPFPRKRSLTPIEKFLNSDNDVDRHAELIGDVDPFTRFDAPSLKLEKGGVTKQIAQRELWEAQSHHKQSTVSKLLAIGRNDLAQPLSDCHTIYTIATCKGCQTIHKFPNRCDRFYCAECQPRLSTERKRAVEWWTREVEQPKHVVLTLVNLPSLTKAHVQQARGFLTRLRRSKFARNWRGGFYSIEVTNEGRGWHLHFHLLVDARWIDAIQLSAQWDKATNHFGRIVKVKDARGKDYLREVTKYAVKGVQLAAWDGATAATFIDAFTGVRTFGVFGSLYGKRTEFAEWFKAQLQNFAQCKCGCSDFRFESEPEHNFRETVSESNARPLPPPRDDRQHDLKLNLAPNSHNSAWLS
jgi:hypothetical protein